MDEQNNWRPLESNPEVFTSQITKVGLTGIKLSDLQGFDPELVSMLQNPSCMLIQCFPSKQSKQVTGEVVKEGFQFINQGKGLGNACGLIAMLHGFLNNPEYSNFILSDSVLGHYKANMGVDKMINEQILKDSGDKIKEIHKSHVEKGQTEIDDNTSYHFVTYIKKDGAIYQFDGHQEGPLKMKDSTATNGQEFVSECESVIRANTFCDEQNIMVVCYDA